MKVTLQDCKKILINVLRICNKKLTNILKNSLQYDTIRIRRYLTMDERLDGQVYVISTDEGESIAEDNKGFILVFDTIKQIGDWAVANNIPFEKIIVDKVNVLGVGEDDK